MTLMSQDHHVLSKRQTDLTDLIPIVECLIGRTEYLSGLAVSLSKPAGDLTEGEIFQQVDLAATEFRRHLDTLLAMLTPGGERLVPGS